MAGRAVVQYQLLLLDRITVALPKDAEILDVQAQGVNPCLWALVDRDAETEQRIFRIVGTGHGLGDAVEQMVYVSTFQMLEGELVFHAFEVVPTVDPNPRGGS